MGARTLLQKSNEKIDKVMEEKAQVPALTRARSHPPSRARPDQRLLRWLGGTIVCDNFRALVSLGALRAV